MLGWLFRKIGLAPSPKPSVKPAPEKPREAPEAPEDPEEEEYVFRVGGGYGRPSRSAAEDIWVRQKKKALKEEFGISEDDFDHL